MNSICFRFSHIWVRMFCYNSNSQVLNRKKWSYAVLISKLCSRCSLGSSSRSKEEVDPIRMLSRGILTSRSVQFSYFDCQVNKFISWLIAGVMFLEGDGRKQNHTWSDHNPFKYSLLPPPRPLTNYLNLSLPQDYQLNMQILPTQSTLIKLEILESPPEQCSPVSQPVSKSCRSSTSTSRSCSTTSSGWRSWWSTSSSSSTSCSTSTSSSSNKSFLSPVGVERRHGSSRQLLVSEPDLPGHRLGWGKWILGHDLILPNCSNKPGPPTPSILAELNCHPTSLEIFL